MNIRVFFKTLFFFFFFLVINMSSIKVIDEVLAKVEELIKIIRSYNNRQLIVTGYYNPFPNLQDHWEDLSELVEYLYERVLNEYEDTQ